MAFARTGRKVALSLVALGISACAQPLPPTFDAQDVTDFDAKVGALNTLGIATTLPTASSATYSGLVGASIDDDGSLIGEIELTADFGADTISGRMHNTNILNNSMIADQLLDGEIAMAGSIDRPAKTIGASGSGIFVAVAEGIKVDIDVTTTVTGTFRTETTEADTITGKVDVVGTIKIPFVEDEDFDASGADFFAQN